MVTPQDWADWRRAAVTEEVVGKLTEKRDDLLEKLLNIEGRSLEEIGLKYVQFRNQLEGLGEFLDVDSLGEWLVEEPTDDD